MGGLGGSGCALGGGHVLQDPYGMTRRLGSRVVTNVSGLLRWILTEDDRRRRCSRVALEMVAAF